MSNAAPEADMIWPYYGCYEFDFNQTIFFNEPREDIDNLGCNNCQEEGKIVFKSFLKMEAKPYLKYLLAVVIASKEIPHNILRGTIRNSSTNTPAE